MANNEITRITPCDKTLKILRTLSNQIPNSAKNFYEKLYIKEKNVQNCHC